ncbi:gamma-glutamylcyclotransferase [Pyruvatibacter mobilis]|jgi:cation transport protein ChaC|uniref:glutathione-specific gamma-glutamylcyclotransferase n=1 Tax=Pyruvatibacter mobilis TaxID=1712261 RepID=A0A845QB89_9HYPH|nr:gamma-glutamylcyclotransferase [Pyruvatibacter mobilis]NBG95321.1 gamma-glutamylcyclotransferase [Pyruvatibacter mobilis]QJD75583.1 gamma-glutamylcyclotransferase [Pyruvatibacter mobilis]GGD16789.1 gamma-glutamylcyclotransferase [Pyruvatibacter mobilis]
MKLSPDGLILRENFTHDRMETLRRELRERGDTTLLSREEQEAGRQAFLRRWDGRSDIWVFGYGSLMWNPAIHVAETQAAKVHGLHRAFCMKLVLGRATPERPGLMLALDHGGSCRGMAHRIAAEHVESETEILWMREMITGSYRPAWISLKVEGEEVAQPAFTFVINRAHKRYAGKLKPETIAKRIARAEGQLGTNRAYLYRTVERLDALGIGDGPMHQLCARVKTLAGD